MATHSQLCDAAVRWLYGTMRCNVALSGIASAREIPDAIGWSTSCRAHGSIVVEAKVSLSDFHRNKAKRHGCKLGNYRYFLVPDGLVTAEQVSEHYPNHGLLHLRRGRCSVIQRVAQPVAEEPQLFTITRETPTDVMVRSMTEMDKRKVDRVLVIQVSENNTWFSSNLSHLELVGLLHQCFPKILQAIGGGEPREL